MEELQQNPLRTFLWAAVVIIVLVSFLADGLSLPLLSDWAAERRAAAEAERARANADLEHARALAEAVEEYNEAAGRAIAADTYTAHPLMYVTEVLPSLFLICGGSLVLLSFALAAAFWRDPERATDVARRLWRG